MTMAPSPDDLDLFVFDLDGTLVRFAIDWRGIRAQVARLLGTDEELSPLLPEVERLVDDPELRRRVYTLIDDAEVAASAGFQPDDETLALFRRLRELRLRLALVTLQGRRPALEALQRIGLGESFDLIITRDEAKSRADQIAMALRGFDVAPGRAIVIADRQADMAAAKALGCLTVAIGAPAEVTADFRAGRVTDLLGTIGWEAS
jgi:phosphoglycolate phosphatase-like HAD superfamily hydrolase